MISYLMREGEQMIRVLAKPDRYTSLMFGKRVIIYLHEVDHSSLNSYEAYLTA